MSDHLVAVVGSVNMDLVVHTELRPGPGETVLGSKFEEVIGGKGFNQAFAAGRVGPTGLVAAVGVDAVDRIRAALTGAGVDSGHLRSVDQATGRAIITVSPDGENSIVVAPMANGALTPEFVVEALDAMRPSTLLLQREIPPRAITAALTWAVTKGARFVLNGSPVAGLTKDELAAADPLVVNVHEARAIVGHGTNGAELAVQLRRTCRSAVVTSGSEGAWVAEADTVRHVPAMSDVDVVDTTGAGDEFAGALCAHLASGTRLVEATERATRAAALIVATPRSQR